MTGSSRSEQLYKKMAGTAAVFVFADNVKASPVERDGMVWTGVELHLDEMPSVRNEKPAMANALSLEGLEDYEPPEDGDVRKVNSLGYRFVFIQLNRSWIQLPEM